MNIIVISEYRDTISPSTIHILNTLDTLKTEMKIDLLLHTNNQNFAVEVSNNTTVYNYSSFIGPEEYCYKEMIIDFVSKNTYDLIILSLEEKNELIVPSIGERLQIQSFLDITDISFHQQLQITKPEYSGNVDAHYILNQKAILAFRDYKETNLVVTNPVVKKVCNIETKIQTENGYLSKTILSKASTSIEDEKFVIVCGFGVGNKENVDKIIRYASSAGAAVAGTKKVIDSGWLPVHLMIGQTGHIIQPDLLITIGVSGAAPFLNGIKGAKTKIAINKDKDARIFNYVDYGIIGDFEEILKEGFDML